MITGGNPLGFQLMRSSLPFSVLLVPVVYLTVFAETRWNISDHNPHRSLSVARAVDGISRESESELPRFYWDSL